MKGADVLLTVRQLQELLQVDRITIYRMLGDGRLQGFKVGGQWRFSRQAIDSWLQEKQADLEVLEPSSEADDPFSPSAEALPLSCIRAIQDIVAQAVGVGVVTTKIDGTPLAAVANCCEFCDRILSSEAGRQRCIASWQASLVTLGKAQPTTCHAGLCYISGRVEVQGRLLAVAHAGQYLNQAPENETWSDRIRELAADCDLNIQDLRQALNRVPVFDADRQQQLIGLLQKMAATFSEIGEERLALLNRLQRIAEITQL